MSALEEQGIAREKVRTPQIAKLEDAWDQQAQELVTIGNQLVNLGCGQSFRFLKIPNMADRGRSTHYGDLLDDSSVLHG
ncbi:hypothetical protein C1886_13120 [Pseudomonas sp. FW300-N1A1]|uniref:hypothetical protein n=1 Tax=Pseudomonas sp. FW300-N1A1 TaxID=2075555 RepID=UPI000CD322BB|nr:hypothetical protein [Pseudomonas sp. FW300-N1A1]POA19333.1 hypothetical protein C1886_13120 [Pseudomonas sp. FW300-N1A1]